MIHAHTGRDYPLAFVVGMLTQKPCVFSRHYYRLNRNPVTRAMFTHVAIVLVVTESLAAKMIDGLKVDPERIRFIPNWTIIHSYSPADTLRIKRKFGLHKNHVVAVIGSLSENKGQREFVNAAVDILRQRSDTTFIIVGVNREVKGTQFYQQLRNTVSIHRLEEDILFLTG